MDPENDENRPDPFRDLNDFHKNLRDTAGDAYDSDEVENLFSKTKHLVATFPSFKKRRQPAPAYPPESESESEPEEFPTPITPPVIPTKHSLSAPPRPTSQAVGYGYLLGCGTCLGCGVLLMILCSGCLALIAFVVGVVMIERDNTLPEPARIGVLATLGTCSGLLCCCFLGGTGLLVPIRVLLQWLRDTTTDASTSARFEFV